MDARLLEIGMFLPDDQDPAQQIDIGIGDILLAGCRHARCAGGLCSHKAGRQAGNGKREQQGGF